MAPPHFHCTVHTHVREKVSDRIKKKNTREREPWMCQGRQERERMDRSLVNVVGKIQHNCV